MLAAVRGGLVLARGGLDGLVEAEAALIRFGPDGCLLAAVAQARERLAAEPRSPVHQDGQLVSQPPALGGRDRVEPRDQVILRQLTQDPFHQERGGGIEVHAPQVEQRIEVDVGDAFREQLLRHGEVQRLGAGSLVGKPDEGGDPRLWSQLLPELRRGVVIQGRGARRQQSLE